MRFTGLLLITACLAAVAPGSAEPVADPSKGWTPAILQNGEPYLPDWSTAGYRWGAALPDPLGDGRRVIEAAAFGVTADDGRDDTAGLHRAVAAAGEVDGPVAVRLPTGRLILREILYLERADLVLVGAGSGDGGTEVHVPRPLAEMELPASIERTRRYLVEADKRVGGELFSPFSWTGGVIWARKPPRAGGVIGRDAATPVDGRRGQRWLRVDDPAGVEPGQTLLLAWRNTDGPDGSLLKHVLGADVPVGDRLHDDPGREQIRQAVTVAAIERDTLELREPLLHDVRPAWRPRLRQTAYLTGVGVQGLRVTFPDVPYKGHHREAGYNGVYFDGVGHGWVRDVVVQHADSGLIIGGHHVTLEDVAVLGRGGHYTVSFGGSGMLCRRFRFEAPAVHNPSFNTRCNHSVYTHGVVHAARLDQHCGLNHQNLFDRITVVYDSPAAARQLFRHGGAAYARPTAGAFNTFWNIKVRVDDANGHAADIPGPTDAPHARLVGLHGNVPLKLRYGPAAHIEGLNRDGVQPASLYEHQRKASDARPSR